MPASSESNNASFALGGASFASDDRSLDSDEVRCRPPAPQVMLVPVGSNFVAYANEVRASLRKAKLFVDVDATDRKMQKKARPSAH